MTEGPPGTAAAGECALMLTGNENENQFTTIYVLFVEFTFQMLKTNDGIKTFYLL